MKSKLDHSSNDRVKSFCENIVVIEEECFPDLNLTDSETFLTALIKREKLRFNQIINFPCDRKQRIC